MCLAYRTLDASPSSTNFEELLSPHGPWKRKDQYNMQMGTWTWGTEDRGHKLDTLNARTL